MKKITILLFYSLTLILLISGCSKTDNDEKELLISKITGTSQSYSYIADYAYDENNQLISISTTHSFDEGSSTNIQTFSYWDNNKIKESTITTDGSTTFKSSYIWAENSLIKMHSGLDMSGNLLENEFKTECILDDDSRVIEVRNLAKSGDEYLLGRMYSKYVWSNNNIDSIKNYILYDTSKSNSENLISPTESRMLGFDVFEYDNKTNPYSGTQLPLHTLNISENNCTKISTFANNFETPDIEENKSYEYNNQGYPTKITTTISQDEGEDYNTQIIIEYIEK